MNLKEIRTWFVQDSGRYDLVVDTTNWADNGADKYINAGQRWLDRLLVANKALGRNFQIVEASTSIVTFNGCRAIQEVWVKSIADTTIGRTKLEKKSIRWMREEYSNMDTIENGTPLYYAPAVLRPAPEPSDLGSYNSVINYLDVLAEPTGHEYDGVVFFPPVDGQYFIETWGLFDAKPLLVDEDESYWTINFPEVVVMAAQAMIEMFSRNSEGVKDWVASIQLITKGIDFDIVEEMIAEVDNMEG